MNDPVRKPRGPKKVWYEYLNLPLARGDKARFDAVLNDGETRLDLIRNAIYAEVQKRETAKRTRAEPRG